MNKKVSEIDETNAADTINLKDQFADGKVSMINQMVSAMTSLGKNDLSFLLNQTLDMVGKEAVNIPDGAAAKNQASIQMKGDAKSAITPNMSEAIQEDLKELFGENESLTEEFVEKASVLFEAAVNARVLTEKETLSEAYETALEEEVVSIQENLEGKIDYYLSRVAEEWAKENEVAIQSSLRTEATNRFIDNMKSVFEHSNYNIPEESVDVVEALTEEVANLRAALNEEKKANMALEEELEVQTGEDIFEEVASGLTYTQSEKLRDLTEAFEYDGNDEKYRNKLKIVKEKYFGVESKENLDELYEQFVADGEEVDEAEKGFVDPSVANYASAISRTVKK